MPQRHKVAKVILTGHAQQRWRERGGKGELTPRIVRHHLLGLLPVGAEVRGTGIEVPIGNGLQAVCVPDFSGAWMVVTVQKAVVEVAG